MACLPEHKGKVENAAQHSRRRLGPLHSWRPGSRRTSCVRKYGLHSFRHAAASLFIEQGFTPKRVQALMGHSTIQMTFDTYGQLFPSEKDDQMAMQQLQARLVS